MRQIQWSSENEVFIAQIDAEHRDLFQLAEGFERAVTQHAPPLAIREHLSAFAAHVAEHFSHEEWLMQSVEYPSYGWHKQQHETVRRRLKLLGPLIESGDSEATDLFLEFLANWLNDHTSVTDRMMAAYVRNYERAHATNAFERWGAPARALPFPSNIHGAVAETLETGPFPKTIRFCRICNRETTHEIKARGLVCQKCVERSVSADLDRD